MRKLINLIIIVTTGGVVLLVDYHYGTRCFLFLAVFFLIFFLLSILKNTAFPAELNEFTRKDLGLLDGEEVLVRNKDSTISYTEKFQVGKVTYHSATIVTNRRIIQPYYILKKPSITSQVTFWFPKTKRNSKFLSRSYKLDEISISEEKDAIILTSWYVNFIIQTDKAQEILEAHKKRVEKGLP